MNVNTGIGKSNIQDGLISLVTFRLDQQTYSLRIEPIRQVIEMVTITTLPQAKDQIEGVINFHGELVPVINLRRQLSLPVIQLQLHTPIILVSISNRLIGLIVDEVLDVLNLDESQIVFPEMVMPAGMKAISALQGLIQNDGKTILCLDIDHLFAPQQASEITAATCINPKDASEDGKKTRLRAIASEVNGEQNTQYEALEAC